MRYYRIEIEGGPTYTSFENGRTNPAALNVAMDIPVAPFATPADAGAYIKIWGIPLTEIAQSKDLRFKNIKVFGGFQRGLPLAKPEQSGLLVQGHIFQPFGNWNWTEQSLDMYLLAGPGPVDTARPNKPRQIVLDWKQGQPMSTAINTSLTTAFPGYTTKINISDRLKLVQDDAALFDTFDAFCRYVSLTSKGIIGTATYPGVSITLRDKVFYVFDNTPADSSSQSRPGSAAGQPSDKQILFEDLIGQPTWIEPPFIQFKCPMRADLAVGDEVTLPKTLVTTSAASQSSLINHNVAFQGKFQIKSIRHVGDFRQPTADAWATVFNAAPLQIEAQ